MKTNNKCREALLKFSAVDLSGLKFPLDGDSSAIYNSDKKEITIPYWRVAELLNEIKVAQDMARSALHEPPEPIGNDVNAKMREALENSNGLLEELTLFGEWHESAQEQIKENKAALTEPPKNGDCPECKDYESAISPFYERNEGVPYEASWYHAWRQRKGRIKYMLTKL